MYKIQLALLFIILCHGCAQSKLHAPTVTDLVDQYTYCDIRSYKDISYNNVYTLDVHCKDQLDTLRRPVILFIHGGGWNSGSKEVWRTPQIEFFAYMGFITVALNYPLSPYPIDTLRPNGILHPRHITSIAKAFRWIYDHIEEYGGDHNQINIIGHSSGAHLALLLATNQRFLQQERKNGTEGAGSLRRIPDGMERIRLLCARQGKGCRFRCRPEKIHISEPPE